MFTSEEKEVLRTLVAREVERFKKEKKVADMGASVKWLKAEHEYTHFLEMLLEKLT